MANRKFTSQFLYQFEAMPVLLSCNFIVDAANGNGLGLRSLKGEGIHAVYMHTSSTPAAGSPNPAAGLIMVQLSNPYARYLGGFSGQVMPLTGSALTTPVAHVANVITALGTTTLAQWQASGLPLGVTPAIGVGFIPATAVAIAGGGAVQLAATGASNIDHIEVVGDPSLGVAAPATKLGSTPNNAIGSTVGGIILLQCEKADALTAPADGTVISLSFYLSNSSVTVKGQ